VAAKRIGLIADAHCHAPGASDLPDAVIEAFRGVSLILALGDMGERAALDRLQQVAPLLATRGADDPQDDARISKEWVLTVEGVKVGALFDLAREGSGIATEGGLKLPDGTVAETLRKVFGEPVAVVAYGGTHRAAIDERDGVLFVNPGSPTLAERKAVAVVEIRDGRATAEIVPIA
jgi:putative phosphoesterase